MNNDTICAVGATGTIGIIRVSGEKAFSICRSVFSKKPTLLVGAKHGFISHTVNYGRIVHNGMVYDEVLLLPMKAPKSYTGEDVIEIHCHGGSRTISKIMELLVSLGVRPAEPGEFTKRAFLNGRLDLSQAEAVSDLIMAKTDYAAKDALNRLDGALKKTINELRHKILLITASIELDIDYPEHEEAENTLIITNDSVKLLISKIEKLIKSSETGVIIKDGIKTVILGKPNVGKSSLMNTLLKKDRAIVTDIPGTTRDSIDEFLNLDGILLHLIDTAGIRETADIIERIGVERSRALAEEAELVLVVVDGSAELDDVDIELIKKIKNGFILINKADLKVHENISKIYDYISDENCIIISTKTHQGMDKLSEKIKEKYLTQDFSLSKEEPLITNLRQKNALINAMDCLKNVLQSVRMQFPTDVYTIDLMAAYKYLGEITGETYDEDIINMIFSEFCLGK